MDPNQRVKNAVNAIEATCGEADDTVVSIIVRLSYPMEKFTEVYQKITKMKFRQVDCSTTLDGLGITISIAV